MAVFLFPLLKVPLIILNSYVGSKSASPPQPPASSTEQKKFVKTGTKPDFLSRNLWWFLPIYQGSMLTIQLCEIYYISSTTFPSLKSAGIYRVLEPVPLNRFAVTITPAFILGTLLVWLGSYIRVLCFQTLGQYFTFQLAIKQDHSLVTHGPYSYVRHPSYTGSLTYLTGMLICQMGAGSWMLECGMWKTGFGSILGGVWIISVLRTLATLMMRTPTEDRILKEEFGKEWDAWAKKTPYRVIPWVF